ncbi:MAG: bifunctional methylenetetrahydrofolate dehydrogenase/methenyltetrahydrofolate cyclohydrolase FolD [Oscillospiraceae bacterium]
MMSEIISGKIISVEIRKEITNQLLELKKEEIIPCLAVIMVGENAASKIYVKNKKKACEEVGISIKVYELQEETTQVELLDLISTLNKDVKTNGILVELPLPKHIDEKAVINLISPQKDVDAFNPINLGKIMIGDYNFLPCTPFGIFELIKSTKIDLTSKKCVIIGRSNIVGKPMAMMMINENATVTICHSQTENLKDITRQADILIVAIGKKNFVTGDMIKSGAIVIDVGMNRDENGKLFGDVDYNEAEKVAGYITPVPGGVGPMTITMLLKNTLKAAIEQNK